MENLIVIQKGSVDLFGYLTCSQKIYHKVHLASLPEQSWYGDFQILLDHQDSYELLARPPNQQKTTSPGLANNAVQVYKLAASKLDSLCRDYRHFRRFLVMRAC